MIAPDELEKEHSDAIVEVADTFDFDREPTEEELKEICGVEEEENESN